MNTEKTFYELADEFGEWFGEPKMPRLDYVSGHAIGFSEGFLKQLELDKEMLAKLEKKS